MTSIEVFPKPTQVFVIKANDYGTYIQLGDIAIEVPGENHEDRVDWLMGFWENLTDYMANHTDPTHLTNWVQKANK